MKREKKKKKKQRKARLKLNYMGTYIGRNQQILFMAGATVIHELDVWEETREIKKDLDKALGKKRQEKEKKTQGKGHEMNRCETELPRP